MKLIVYVIGLAILSPDRQGDLHVFFPETDHRHGVEMHEPRIHYRAGAREVSYDLTDHRIDLGAVGTSGSKPGRPDAVFPLDVFARPAPTDWLHAGPPREVMARVTLPAPERIEGGAPALWSWQTSVTSTRAMYLTNAVSITIDLPAEDIPGLLERWTAAPLRAGMSTPGLALPDLVGDSVVVFLTGLPMHPTGGAVPIDSEARHFRAYLRALDIPGPFPRLLRIGGVRRGSFVPTEHKSAKGASPLNCMLAWASIKR